jgi:hypothetical protein
VEQQAEQPSEADYPNQQAESERQVTEPISIENRKISVSFSRKVSDGNYGSREATAWVQGDVAPDAPISEVALALGDLFLSAQSAVLDQLQIEYKIDTENGTLVEKQVTPAAAAEAAIRTTFGTQNVTVVPDGGGDGSIRVMNPGDQQGPLPDWLVAACRRDGITAVWDNRSKATGKQPLFKEAIPRGGTGHGKDGEAKAFWAPKGN